MEVISFGDTTLNDFFTTALSRRNLIPIIGAGFTRGATARVGKVLDGKELQDIMIEKICKYCPDIVAGDFVEDGDRSTIPG